MLPFIKLAEMKPPAACSGRKAKGKRLICRLVDKTAKLCIYRDGEWQFFVRGEKVARGTALRAFCAWVMRGAKMDYMDEPAMRQLTDSVLPHVATPNRDDDDDDDDGAGESWKAAAE